MYNLNRPGVLPISVFGSELFATYIQSEHKISSHQRQYHRPENRILLENITQEILKFYSSPWKGTFTHQQQYDRLIMLSNLKQLVMFDSNQNGFSLQHKMLYIVYTYFEGLVRQYRIDWNLLRTIFLLTNQDQILEQLPSSIKLLLNFQYEELISYLHESYSENLDQRQKVKLQFLLQLIQKKMIQTPLNSNEIQVVPVRFPKSDQDHKVKFANLILSSNKKKNSSQKSQWSFSLKSKQHTEIDLLCAIFSSNREIIEQICRGNWSLYLHFYLTFIKSQKIQAFQMTTIVNDYVKKYNKNFSIRLNIAQQYCLNLVSRMPLIQTYELGFHIMGTFTNNVIVYQALDMNISKFKILVNIPDFESSLQNNLLENASNISWKTMLNVICILNRGSGPVSQSLFQNLLHKYLPYDFDEASQMLNVQEKLKDLSKMGLTYMSDNYLSSLFDLYINRQRCLTPTLLNTFVLNLQFSSNSYKSSIFRRMKQFLGIYFKFQNFNYQLLDILEDLIQRKEQIFDEKIIYKIQQMYSIMYKNKNINDQQTPKGRVALLHKLLNNKSEKCFQTLKIILKTLKQLQNQQYCKAKKNQVDNESQMKSNRSLKMKVIDYLKLWEQQQAFSKMDKFFQERKRVRKVIMDIKEMIF